MSEHFIDLFGLQVPVTYYIKIGERVYGDEPHVDPLFRGKRIVITDMLHYLPEYSQADREFGIYEHEDKGTLWAVRAYGKWFLHLPVTPEQA